MGAGELFRFTSGDLTALVLVYLLIAIVLAVSLAVQKRYGDRFDVRKIIHIGIGNFVFIWWMFEDAWVMEAFFAVPFAVILFAAMLKENIIAKSALGDISKNKGHRQGLFLYVVSIVILVAFCFNEHWTAASIGIVAMTWGDGFGSIVGKRFGKHRTINGKTAEGTLAVFAVTAVVSLILITVLGAVTLPDPSGIRLVATIPLWACCIIAGVVSSVVETISPGWVDNLANCMAVTATMVLLGL